MLHLIFKSRTRSVSLLRVSVNVSLAVTADDAVAGISFLSQHQTLLRTVALYPQQLTGSRGGLLRELNPGPLAR